MMYRKGFTLIELLVTLSIASILIAVSAPSFRQLTVRNRLVTYTNDFIATVNFARSEAVRRGTTISICRSNNGTSCGGNWSDGWIVFHNANNDQPAVVGSGETVLKVHDRLSSSYTMNATASFANNITFAADGTAQAAGAFAVCHQDKTVGARAIVVTQLRPRVGRDTDGDGIPNKDVGNITSCASP